MLVWRACVVCSMLIQYLVYSDAEPISWTGKVVHGYVCLGCWQASLVTLQL